MPDVDEPTTPLSPVSGLGSTPAGATSTSSATSTSPATSPASGAGPGPATSASPARPGPRMRTLVLGLILLVVAGSVLVGQLTSINVDGGVVFLSLMVVAGLLLIAGSATRRNP